MGVDAAVEYIAGFAFGLLIFQALFMKDMPGGSYWRAVKGTWVPEWLSMNAVMAGMIPVMIILMTKDIRAMEPTSFRFWGVMSLASLVGATLAYPVNWWLVKNGLKHGMGTERALGRSGTKVVAERTQRFTAAATATGTPARAANDSSRPVHNIRAVPDKSGISRGETLPPTYKATVHLGTGDAPAPNMSGMKKGSVSAGSKVLVTLLTIVMLAGGVMLAALYGDLSMRASGMQGIPMSMPMPQ